MENPPVPRPDLGPPTPSTRGQTPAARAPSPQRSVTAAQTRGVLGLPGGNRRVTIIPCSENAHFTALTKRNLRVPAQASHPSPLTST